MPEFVRTLVANPGCLACRDGWPRYTDGEHFAHLLPQPAGLCKCPVVNQEEHTSQPSKETNNG